jgi:hypothetical protein
VAILFNYLQTNLPKVAVLIALRLLETTIRALGEPDFSKRPDRYALSYNHLMNYIPS